jgi:hypothetical protein
MMLIHLLFITILSFIESSKVDLTQLNIGVWLSGAAYCSKELYKIMKLGGPASGFEYKYTIYNKKTDLQGYIGILDKTKSIYIVLRGSSSIMNWLNDFEIKLVNYKSYPECNCFVHNGFFYSALGITNTTLQDVKAIIELYPDYSVVVTGHSYGAACGQLLAMELERNGIHVKIYNYGQPRVGDSKYATFVNKIISEYWRGIHNKDIVPHVPPSTGFGYIHSCREIFEDENGKLSECSEINCEDSKCAGQYSLSQTNSSDHFYYLGHYFSCEESIL